MTLESLARLQVERRDARQARQHQQPVRHKRHAAAVLQAQRPARATAAPRCSHARELVQGIYRLPADTPPPFRPWCHAGATPYAHRQGSQAAGSTRVPATARALLCSRLRAEVNLAHAEARCMCAGQAAAVLAGHIMAGHKPHHSRVHRTGRVQGRAAIKDVPCCLL